MHRAIMALLGVCLLAVPALAQDEDPVEFTKETYPQELARRPLILAPGMVQVTLGGMSDFAAAAPADAVRSRFDAIFAPIVRLQLGLESDLEIAGDNSFQARDVAAWLEYSLLPTMSLRAGGYVQKGPGDANDAVFGVRVGAPMKLKLSPKASLLLTPRWGMDASGAQVHVIDLPVGVQLSVAEAIAFFVSSGVAVADYRFENDTVAVPAAVGIVLTPGRKFDIGADFRITDLTGGTGVTGIDDRWVSAWIQIRK